MCPRGALFTSFYKHIPLKSAKPKALDLCLIIPGHYAQLQQIFLAWFLLSHIPCSHLCFLMPSQASRFTATYFCAALPPALALLLNTLKEALSRPGFSTAQAACCIKITQDQLEKSSHGSSAQSHTWSGMAAPSCSGICTTKWSWRFSTAVVCTVAMCDVIPWFLEDWV